MDTRQIEYILQIAEENNITKAAEKLFITQSALNQQLLKLEKEATGIYISGHPMEQYAEMCRYQNKQRGKLEEDSLVNEEENENGENKSKTENAEKEKNLEKLMITLI